MPLPAIPPAGLTPLATPTSDVFAARGARVAYLDEAVDSVTGELTSITSGTDSVDRAFLLQLRAVFGSGAALGQGGHRFRDIKKNLESTPQEIRNEVDRIARPFVERGDIRIVRVTTEVVGDSASLVIDWHNERTGRGEQKRVLG